MNSHSEVMWSLLSANQKAPFCQISHIFGETVRFHAKRISIQRAKLWNSSAKNGVALWNYLCLHSSYWNAENDFYALVMVNIALPECFLLPISLFPLSAIENLINTKMIPFNTYDKFCCIRRSTHVLTHVNLLYSLSGIQRLFWLAFTHCGWHYTPL